ncbi:type I methionyl aminopeptidase [Microbispora hainanensis]|uniref:Methionine aminopeptidase n=1 Tax=Microbispora hainanensis TaxID=568844 RepID=A0ABZ1SFH1_9ACTN|nr:MULTISPECIES: type I methionyl aminopeptidase [Microbispora]NJP25790.1 type I methionyl aminopeptidase [Microbispora sp. CL1-1]TQS13274.1 type I methionyl aminopeptidase [Microbispora sp. SCL1-1]
MVEIKSDAALDAMREAGRVVARTLDAVRKAAAIGVRLTDLDETARAVLREAGASSPFLGYRPPFAPTPFPAVICVSVNDAIVHGIPTGYRLRDGDVVGVDAGAVLDGWAADAAVTFIVGTPRPGDLELVDTTRRALEAGIAAATVGNRIGDISAAIGAIAKEAGYGMPRDFGGHGIGRRMHEDPSVPNHGRPGRGYPLRHGLTLAIEPMFIAGGRDGYHTAGDGWTLHSTDGSRAAHMEHTIAVTEDGPRVLTVL